DGVDFDVFNQENTPVLSDDIIRCLLVDRSGVLWISTRRGGIICYKNGGFEKSYTTKDGLLSNDVPAISQSHDGSLWIGTANGVNRLESGKISAVRFHGTAAASDIQTLVEDSSGHLWIGTTEGLFVAAGWG
ncbi:MAG: hypothetical protein GTO45_28795, partial [Candidatus Aminicenantes bacterium]|nr:hypothetical protein [Candidatus Aminicenantes bacterium]NIM82586.1 hypothetical protein [Candidatus Aminicenantes bacterium]NIN22173.1 hypothetical protein [Candidatus Aminicenantes bacterium]NIN45933.1 hypothetical protein [Candidatus Aminicenantes bacterium]NIN88769.1 hypothetical protein [Candidatus Aminicenantes bacterium]